MAPSLPTRAGRIDSHQHFWRYHAPEFAWIVDGMQVLQRDWLPPDLLPLLAANGMDRCIAVQARCTEEETDFLLALAARYPWIAAVVGWAELRSGDVAPRLDRWQGHHKLKGIRHILQDEADVPEMLARADFRRNVAAVQARQLVYEVLVNSRQFAGVADFCARLDGHTLVLDHLGKPDIRDRSPAVFASWRDGLQPLAALPHVMCKLSGLVTEAAWAEGRLQGFSPQDFHPYLDTALELFGAERLMFGSDWPVCLLAQGYGGVCGVIETWAGRLSADEQAALWGGNAERCYAIDRPSAQDTNHNPNRYRNP